MKSTIQAFLLAVCMVLELQSYSSYEKIVSPKAFVVRFSETQDLELVTLPKGTKILSTHFPYHILVVSNETMDSESFKNELFKLASATHIDIMEEDESGNPVLPTGIAIYEARAELQSKCDEFCKNLNVKTTRKFNALGWTAVELPKELSYESFISDCNASGLFSKVMRDEIITAQQHVTNDPFWANSWHINQYNDKDIDADDAWSIIPAGTSNKTIAIIDGHGFDTAHPDMIDSWADTYNAVNQTTNVTPGNIYEKHGTPCAGIPGAICNNSIGTAGLGNNYLQVQAIQIGYNASSSGSFSTSSLYQADAINHVMLTTSAVAISMSFGGTTYQTTFLNAINSARLQGRNGKGIPVFASAGNDGSATWTNYPASYTGVIAVGSSTSSDMRSSFSNYGTGLSLAAPGSGIPTIDISGTTGYSTSDYTNFSGTSAASPVAASVGAMILTANPTLTEAQVKQIMAQTCEKTGGYSYTSVANYPLSTWSNELGYGRINMYAAVQQALLNTPVLPDLTLANVSSSATNVIAGQSITISADQIISPSNGATVYPVLEYRWSTDQIWSASDIIIGTDASTLAGGISSETENTTFVIPTGTGTRYILVRADTGGSITESNENNNMTVIAITVIAATVLPDISVSGFAVNDNTPNVGQTISISCSQNISSALISTSDVILEYRYSTDALWSATDISIGFDTSSIGTLIASSTEAISYLIPAGIGIRYLLVKADVGGLVAESNETNNTLVISLTVAEALPVPDVTITQLTSTGTAVTEGQSVTIICQQVMTNTTSTALAIDVQYRWSTDLTWSTTDQLLGTGTSSLSTSNTSETESITFNIPTGVGTYYLLVMADASNTVVESNESNVYSLTFTVTPPSTTPDIFLDGIAATSVTVTPGQSVTISCLQNVSLPAISATNVFMEYRWATGSTFSSSYPIVGVDYSSLGAGDPNDPEDLTFTVPAGTGIRYIMIICDSNNGVSESNENNNIYLLPMNVQSAASAMIEESDEKISSVTEKHEILLENLNELTAPQIEFNLFPNPANEYFTLSIIKSNKISGQYEIRNLQGELITSGKLVAENSSQRIETNSIPNGIYFIQLMIGSQLKSERFIVSH